MKELHSKILNPFREQNEIKADISSLNTLSAKFSFLRKTFFFFKIIVLVCQWSFSKNNITAFSPCLSQHINTPFCGLNRKFSPLGPEMKLIQVFGRKCCTDVEPTSLFPPSLLSSWPWLSTAVLAGASEMDLRYFYWCVLNKNKPIKGHYKYEDQSAKSKAEKSSSVTDGLTCQWCTGKQIQPILVRVQLRLLKKNLDGNVNINQNTLSLRKVL